MDPDEDDLTTTATNAIPAVAFRTVSGSRADDSGGRNRLCKYGISPDTRPRRGQIYAAGLTSFLADFVRAGDFFGIATLKTSKGGRPFMPQPSRTMSSDP